MYLITTVMSCPKVFCCCCNAREDCISLTDMLLFSSEDQPASPSRIPHTSIYKKKLIKGSFVSAVSLQLKKEGVVGLSSVSTSATPRAKRYLLPV